MISSTISSTFPPAMWLGMALLFSSASVVFTFALWRGAYFKWLVSALTGLSVIVGLTSFIQFSGPEFGTVYFFIIIAFSAWFLVFRQASSTPLKPLPQRKQAKIHRKNSALRASLKTLLMVVLCGCSGILTMIFITLLLPLPQNEQLAFAAVLFPLTWAAYIVWLSITNNLLRTVMILSSLSGVMAWNIFGVMS